MLFCDIILLILCGILLSFVWQLNNGVSSVSLIRKRYNIYLCIIYNILFFFRILEAHGTAANTWLQSGSWSLVCSKGPFVPYESPVQLVPSRAETTEASESIPLYGSMELT